MTETTITALCAVGALIISLLTTRFLLLYLRKNGVLDIPNERSSHKIPTPRGGGIGIMAGVVLVGAFYAIWLNEYSFLPILGFSLLMGLMGWADDVKGGLSPGLRFGIQVLSSIGVVAIYGPIEVLPLPAPADVNMPYIVGAVLSIIWLVGITNIFNFLDGIDGYAGTQALIAGLALSVMFWGSMVGFTGLVIALASLGFLFFNWHPAKIFMGDVGSSFLGFLFAVLPFYLDTPLRTEGFFAVAFFLWFFLTDGSLTMIRRVLQGEKIWVAHRSHFYQRLVISGMSHSRVVLFIVALYIALFAVFFHYLIRLEQVMAWPVVLAGILLFAFYWIFTARRDAGKKELAH